MTISEELELTVEQYTPYPVGAKKTSTLPKMDGDAYIGDELTYAAGDHVHPSDTRKVSTSLVGAANGICPLDSSAKIKERYIPDSIPSEFRSVEDDIALLSTRVDEIIAPSGEAPSAAEVTDARIGADGTTYTSLGLAIRGQVDDLNADIASIGNGYMYLGEPIHDEYVTTEGVITPYTNWWRTDYIDVSNMEYIFVSKNRAGAYNCFYDENKNFVSSFSILQAGTNVYVPRNAKYVIISDMSTYIKQLTIKGTTKADYNIGDAILHAYPTSKIPNETDYNTLLTKGSYVVEYNADAQTMTNCPVNTSHRLEIFQVSQSSRLIQLLTPSNTLGKMWYRLYDSASFSRWYSVGGDSSDSSGVPDYYKDHVEEKEVLIRKNISDVGFVGDSFAIVADTHWGRNTKNSPSLIKHIAEHTPINRLMLMGDYYITQSTKALAYKAMQDSIGAFRSKGMDLHIISGNHDYNHGTVQGYPILTEAEVYGQIMTGQNSVIRSDDTCTFYFDNTQLKIRYYFTSCMHDSSYNVDSYKWIFRQMVEIPSGYKVIVFTHTGLSGSGARNHNYAQYLTGALKALRDKTTYTFGNETFDYTNTDALPIAIFSGHHHVDYVFSDNEIACIQTTTDAYYYEDSSNYPDDEIPTLERTVGTISEQAFDVATVDAENDVVYLTRVGGGNNRIIHCADTAVQTTVTLTSMLEGALTWKSDNENVVTVSNSGVVTKVGAGNCVVSASDESGTVEYWMIVA